MPGLQMFKHNKLTYGIVTLRNIRKWELFGHKESSAWNNFFNFSTQV